MNAASIQIHGRKNLSRWQVEQAAQREISRTSYRSPNFVWRKDAPRNRATVTVYLTLTDNRITKTNVVIARNFYRGGERRYMNVSLASLRRLSSIAPLPLLTDAQFEAAGLALVAQEMLDAAHKQQESTVKCPKCGKWARPEGERYYHIEEKYLDGSGIKRALYCEVERVEIKGVPAHPLSDVVDLMADLDLIQIGAH